MAEFCGCIQLAELGAMNSGSIPLPALAVQKPYGDNHEYQKRPTTSLPIRHAGRASDRPVSGDCRNDGNCASRYRWCREGE